MAGYSQQNFSKGRQKGVESILNSHGYRMIICPCGCECSFRVITRKVRGKTTFTRTCEQCKTDFQCTPYQHEREQRRFCSISCWKTFLSENRKPKSGGYIRLAVGKDVPGSDALGRMLEHRYIMQEHIGRPLKSHEIIHHKNNVKTDNRIENLEIVSTIINIANAARDGLLKVNEGVTA